MALGATSNPGDSQDPLDEAENGLAGEPDVHGGWLPPYHRPAALGLRLKPPWLVLSCINGVFGRRLLNWFLIALAGVAGLVCPAGDR